MFPTRLPDQVDRELTPGRIVAAGTGALGRDASVSADQAQAPDLPRWQALLEGKESVLVPPNNERFLLWDLDNYYCAYPICEISGGTGAKLTWSWAESLYLPRSEAKGNRGEFIGKTFRGMTDTFLPDAGAHRKFSTLWWRAGRWCLISIKTAEEPLTVHRLALDESRYPSRTKRASKPPTRSCRA